MPNLELYRIFKIVADEGNLTRASEKLFISQPAVTKHIHNLEDELKVKLFERTQHGIILTQDGKKLYNQIKDSVDILSSVKNNIKEITNIQLGIQVNLSNEFYRPIIAKFKEQNPNINFTIDKTYTENMFSMIEKNEIDMYLSKKQPNDIHNESIKFIGLGNLHDDFFVSSNSKYVNKKITQNEEIIVYTLRKISITSHNLEKAVKNSNYKNVIIKNSTFSTILEEMQNNDIIAYITEEYLIKELNDKKIVKLDIALPTQNEVEYGIYYSVNNKLKNIEKYLKV